MPSLSAIKHSCATLIGARPHTATGHRYRPWLNLGGTEIGDGAWGGPGRGGMDVFRGSERAGSRCTQGQIGERQEVGPGSPFPGILV